MNQPSGNPPPELFYAGRWVALVRGKVVAQAATQQEAFRLARLSRRKDPLEIRYMPPFPVNYPVLQTILQNLPTDTSIYLAGGAVRDAVLQRPIHDLDFATPPGALRLAKRLADKLSAAFFPLDEENDTARIILQHPDGSRDLLDFAGFRGETLQDDLRGRDFTINAIAMDLRTGEILDPLGGLADLQAKILRPCSPTALTDDPIRLLRAIRQAASLGFSLHPQTRQQMKEAVPLLVKVSAERQRDELFKILAGPQPDASLRALQTLGVLPHLLPELAPLLGQEQSPPHVYDVWNHTLAVLRHLNGILAVLAPQYNEEKSNADLFNGLLSLKLGKYRAHLSQHLAASLNADRSARALLFFAALYHDTAKPLTRTTQPDGRIRFLGHDEKGAALTLKRAIALRLSNDEMNRAKEIVASHMKIHFHTRRKHQEAADPSPKAIYRYFRQSGSAGIDLLLLGLADTRATYEQTLTQEAWVAALDVTAQFMEAWFEKAEEIIAPPALLNGNDLMTELPLKPGPEIGTLLEAIREHQVSGNIHTRAEALAFALGWHFAKTHTPTGK